MRTLDFGMPEQLARPIPVVAAQNQSAKTTDESFLSPSEVVGSAPPIVKHHVASFGVTVFEAFQPFEAIPGLAIPPLPGVHEEDFISFHFLCLCLYGWNSR